MLADSELDCLFDKLGISAAGRAMVNHIRTSPPNRQVGSGPRNFSVKFPSNKMHCIIQADSGDVEFPAVYDKEFDQNVYEFWDQAGSAKLNYIAKNGRPVGVVSTPDFFVIERDGMGWEEWKSEDQLPALAEKMPNRFVKDGDRWRCPPGEEFARQFGFFFRLRSSAEIDWNIHRNQKFLRDFLDHQELTLPSDIVSSIAAEVIEHPGITLDELLAMQESSTDVLYAMIARQQIYVNLKTEVLAEPEFVHVFRDFDTAKGHNTANSFLQKPERLFVNVAVGASICWDGQVWTITNRGLAETSLIQEDGTHVDIPNSTFDGYIQSAKISNPKDSGSLTLHSRAQQLLSEASPSDFEEANRRFELIAPYVTGKFSEEQNNPSRTIRRYIRNWRDAEAIYSCAYVGLLRKKANSGNRESRLSEETQKNMTLFISENYEDVRRKNMTAVFQQFQEDCRARGILSPSYTTFCREIHKRDPYEQTEKREGTRAAYQKKAFYFALTMTTPRHGDRPFEICHIDHTELDIELISSRTKRNLGRPWLTILMDAYSRRILAFNLSFDPPSYRSCMTILRECVRQHSRLPETVVVDGGREFKSIYFETFLALYQVTKLTRRVAHGRDGSVCERLFGTTNTRFVHNLIANTQNTRNVRQITKSVNPKRLAAWTLQRLHSRMHEWAGEVHDTIDHPALGETPREAFTTGLITGGARMHKLIPYDQTFHMLSSPTTSKGLATVHPQSGVKINYITYWSDIFRDPNVAGKKVPVRYDPFNVGLAYAYVKKEWVQCVSQHFRVFDGKSEREIQLASAILRKQNRLHTKQGSITARKMADFLNSLEAEELLQIQRLQDDEYKDVLVADEPAPEVQEPEDQDTGEQPDQKALDDSQSQGPGESDEDFDSYKDF